MGHAGKGPSLYDCIYSSDEGDQPSPVKPAAVEAQPQPARSDTPDSEGGTSDEDVKMLPAAKRQALMQRPSLQARNSGFRDEVCTSSEQQCSPVPAVGLASSLASAVCRADLPQAGASRAPHKAVKAACRLHSL